MSTPYVLGNAFITPFYFLDARLKGHEALGLSFWSFWIIPLVGLLLARLAKPREPKGRTIAQYNLGNMYEHGEGVPPDLVEALKWYSLVASSRSPLDAELRNLATNSRDRVAAKMTPAEIAEAQKLANE